MGRGYAWLDTGTHESLLDAGNYVRTITERQGLQVGSPDVVAFEFGLIDSEKLKSLIKNLKASPYKNYLAGKLVGR